MKIDITDGWVDLVERRYACGERQGALSVQEAKILRVLLDARGEVVPREQVEQIALGQSASVSSRALDVALVRLRKKLEVDVQDPVHLLTERGVGYAFQCRAFESCPVGRELDAVQLMRTVEAGTPVVLGGGIGVGKSWLAVAVGRHMGWTVIDLERGDVFELPTDGVVVVDHAEGREDEVLEQAARGGCCAIVVSSRRISGAAVHRELSSLTETALVEVLRLEAQGRLQADELVDIARAARGNPGEALFRLRARLHPGVDLPEVFWHGGDRLPQLTTGMDGAARRMLRLLAGLPRFPRVLAEIAEPPDAPSFDALVARRLVEPDDEGMFETSPAVRRWLGDDVLPSDPLLIRWAEQVLPARFRQARSAEHMHWVSLHRPLLRAVLACGHPDATLMAVLTLRFHVFDMQLSEAQRDAVLNAARTTKDAELAVRALGMVAALFGPMELFDEGEARAEGDSSLVAHLAELRSFVHGNRGEVEASLDWLQQATHQRRGPDAARVWYRRGALLHRMARWEEAQHDLLMAIGAAGSVEDDESLWWVFCARTTLQPMRGELLGSMRVIDQMLEQIREHGRQFDEPSVWLARAEVQLMLRDFEGAEDSAQRALEGYRQLGLTALEAEAILVLAIGAALSGDWMEAWTRVRAVDTMFENGEHLTIQAVIARQLGLEAEAKRCLDTERPLASMDDEAIQAIRQAVLSPSAEAREEVLRHVERTAGRQQRIQLMLTAAMLDTLL